MTPPPIEGAFYVCREFVFQLHQASVPYRYTCLRDWNGHWGRYQSAVIGDEWVTPERGEPWRIIGESDPLFDECCRRAALRALTQCQED